MWITGSGYRLTNFNKSLIDEIHRFPKNETKIVVGSDSQMRKDDIVFVTTVIVLHKGIGGNFFYKKDKIKNRGSISILENRLFQEAVKSVEVANEVNEMLKDINIKVDEIHVDVNSSNKFKSNKIASACIGYITGCGFNAVIKPYSFAASDVADRKTRS